MKIILDNDDELIKIVKGDREYAFRFSDECHLEIRLDQYADARLMSDYGKIKHDEKYIDAIDLYFSKE